MLFQQKSLFLSVSNSNFLVFNRKFCLLVQSVTLTLIKFLYLIQLHQYLKKIPYLGPCKDERWSFLAKVTFNVLVKRQCHKCLKRSKTVSLSTIWVLNSLLRISSQFRLTNQWCKKTTFVYKVFADVKLPF